MISWDLFQEVALSCGIPGPLIPKAASYLHELGSLVHFNEHESGLDDLVVLDSQWLTNVFSDVITLKHNFVKEGILSKKDLPQIWKPPAYPENVHDSLVALLEKFEVAYPLSQLPGEEGIIFYLSLSLSVYFFLPNYVQVLNQRASSSLACYQVPVLAI